MNGPLAADVEDPPGGVAAVGAGLARVVAGRGLGGSVVDTDNALDDVVDVGEVAMVIAVVEDVDRLAFEDALHEQEG